MPAPVPVWQAKETLSDLTLYADWDAFSSMILSLRIYLFEYGTIPVWNFMFCGGRPELAVAHSWAWTWPSAFAYLLEPNHAILAVWITLTGVGFAATRALLIRWSGSRLGASVGAAVYALSGLYAARFNAGHVTFAFLHLVPLMMLVFERAFARALEGGPNHVPCAIAVLVSFAFCSAALPHGLIYFYPAFALFVIMRVAGARRRLSMLVVLRATTLLVTANALGAWLAAYRLVAHHLVATRLAAAGCEARGLWRGSGGRQHAHLCARLLSAWQNRDLARVLVLGVQRLRWTSSVAHRGVAVRR